MEKKKGFCITSDDTTDNFVGIRFLDGKPEVIFPHGYNIPDDPKEQRKDIFKLLGVLQSFSTHREGERVLGKSEMISSIPIQSYQYIIQDYLTNGYYIEKETTFQNDTKGKISWKRTIQKHKPIISNGNIIYTDYEVTRSVIRANSLLSHIHKYCVWFSFLRFGWLYFPVDFLPEKPAIRFDLPLFVSTVKYALDNTFDDRKRSLFKAMIHVLQTSKEDISFRNYSLGVNHFESVWENLINYVFGEDDIDKYFPHAEWHILRDGRFTTSSALEPDTVMKFNGKIYILDAKYYKYGISNDPNDLPSTSSIQKQITYARHVEKLGEVASENIYNAFVLPYKGSNGDYVPKFVAVGKAGWEDYSTTNNYTYILGILIDTRHLITTFAKRNLAEIVQLANLIESSLEEYKKQAFD